MSNKVEIGMQYEPVNRYALPKIYVGDTVAVNERAKLQWYAPQTKDSIIGRTGKVVFKGKYVYTVLINGTERFFSRMDLKRVM